MNFMFMFELKLGIAIFEVFRAVVDIRGQHHASRGARGKLPFFIGNTYIGFRLANKE